MLYVICYKVSKMYKFYQRRKAMVALNALVIKRKKGKKAQPRPKSLHYQEIGFSKSKLIG